MGHLRVGDQGNSPPRDRVTLPWSMLWSRTSATAGCPKVTACRRTVTWRESLVFPSVLSAKPIRRPNSAALSAAMSGRVPSSVGVRRPRRGGDGKTWAGQFSAERACPGKRNADPVRVVWRGGARARSCTVAALPPPWRRLYGATIRMRARIAARKSAPSGSPAVSFFCSRREAEAARRFNDCRSGPKMF